MIAMDKSSNYISQLLIGLLVAAGIFNTLLMSVLERKREFGIMMAVGMSPVTLFRLIVIESLFLAVLGLAVGVLLSTPWYAYLSQTGLDFSSTFGEGLNVGGVLLDPVFKVKLYAESVVAILSAVLGLSLLSGLYPAWRAGRVPPVESLKTL